MPKRHPKRPVPPTKPITYRRLYTKTNNDERVGLMVGIIILMGGCYISTIYNFSDGPLQAKLGLAFIIFFGAFILLNVIFGTLQVVLLDGENLIFSYRFKNKIYKASTIESIAWGTGIYMRNSGGMTIDLGSSPRFPGDLGPSGDINGMYGRYTALFIKLENGKMLEIPGSPDARIDIEKILLDWHERYNLPES